MFWPLADGTLPRARGQESGKPASGPFEVEADSTGKVTLKHGAANASYDRASKQVGIVVGGSISLRDLVTEGLKLRGKDGPPYGEPTWLKKLPELKAEVSLNLQLSRPSEVLAVVSNAPGLVALGARTVFMEADWGSLSASHRDALERLGWDEHGWDKKRLPKSAKTAYEDLTSDDKMAVARLPVPREGLWMDFWAELVN